jgi:hypothetical protein
MMPINKRRRAQGRRRIPAVIIPPDRERDRLADEIRALDRQRLEQGGAYLRTEIAIGRRLIKCRKQLKEKRLWLAWLKAEFKWSRRHADRFIAIARNPRKCATLRTLGLPISAIYLLANASPEATEEVTRQVEAGEVPSVRVVAQVVHHAVAPKRYVNVAFERQTATPIPYEVGPDRSVEVDRFLRQFEIFAGNVSYCRARPEEIAAAVPADERPSVAEKARDIVAFMSALARELGGEIKLITDGDNGTAE